VHEELKRRGVTLMILREEHRAERADGRRDRAGICIVQAKVALSLSIAVPWTGAIRDHPIFDKLSADQATRRQQDRRLYAPFEVSPQICSFPNQASWIGVLE
jgi:hypothetical protein